MPVVSLDTHAVVKELQAAGFTEAQAEAVTRAVRRAQDLDLSQLATKADLAETNAQIEALRQATRADIEALRQATKADMDSLRLGTRSEIAELKADLLKWIIGLIGVQTIAVIGALIAMTRVLVR